MTKSVDLRPNIQKGDVKFRIKEVAKMKGVRIQDIADAIKKDQSYVSKIDNGHVNTTINVVQSIADALEVPVHELVEPSKGFGHFYVEGVWQGIRKV